MKRISLSRLYLYALFLILGACTLFSTEDYKVIHPGLELKLIEIGSDDTGIHPGDYLTVHFTYMTLDDSLFYEGRTKFRYEGASSSFVIGPAFKDLQQGDSISLIVNTEEYFSKTLKAGIPTYLVSSKEMKINMRILDVQSEPEFRIEKELFLEWVQEFYESESDRIRSYLNDNHLIVEPSATGLYYIPLKRGTGPAVVPGKKLRIHYQGRFLNGYFIDDTYKRDEPLEFVFGTDFYVIDGLEEALLYMKEGGKALVIVPSDLGFGAMGSAGGLVPPYTTLIYELEVIKVY